MRPGEGQLAFDLEEPPEPFNLSCPGCGMRCYSEDLLDRRPEPRCPAYDCTTRMTRGRWYGYPQEDGRKVREHRAHRRS